MSPSSSGEPHKTIPTAPFHNKYDLLMKDIFVNISKLLFESLDVSFQIQDVKKAELSRLGEKLIPDLILQVKIWRRRLSPSHRIPI